MSKLDDALQRVRELKAEANSVECAKLNAINKLPVLTFDAGARIVTLRVTDDGVMKIEAAWPSDPDAGTTIVLDRDELKVLVAWVKEWLL